MRTDIDPQNSREALRLDACIRFQTPHLERVSRSFAYGISRLTPKLRASVGLAYLVCRLLDTIEDARWTDRAEQERVFAGFETFVEGAEPPDLRAVARWAGLFPASISEGERALLSEAAIVFTQLTELDAKERAAILKPVLSMSRGMRSFAGRRLESLADVNLYCFFVAGVVGELLTGLIVDDLRPSGLERAWNDGIHFGLFLQKINVLKDQWGDESEGRFLVPDRAAVLESLRANAVHAFAYLEAIPDVRRDYRLFCAWSLYLGLATVPLLRASVRGDERPAKQPRLAALALGAKIELFIDQPERLRAMFEELLAAAWPAGAVSDARERSASVGVAEFLRANYRGRLDLAALEAVLRA